MTENTSKKKLKPRSLAFKVMVVLTAVAVLFSIGYFLLSQTVTRELNFRNYGNVAENYARAASGYINPRSIEKIGSENGDQTQEYKDLYRDLENFYEHTDELVKYLYIYQIKTNSKGEHLFRVIYDSDKEDPDPYGYTFNMKEDYEEEMDTPLTKPDNNKVVGPIVTNGQWGWLMSVYVPVINRMGKTEFYVIVDMDMEQVMAEIRVSEAKIVLVELGLLLLVLASAYLLVQYLVLGPLFKLEAQTRKFRETREIDDDPELEIRTGDEFESLYNAFRETQRVIVDDRVKMEELLQKIHGMAYRDDLTGVRSANAYDEKVLALEDSIHNGEGRFALVMIDMNGLKQINDKFGHGYGDMALKECSKVICTQFKHSPIYRVGGDEFVAILETQDYENVEVLIEDFRQYEVIRDMSVEEPWTEVAVSVGYAVYDPARHESTMDVFQEADAKMYEHKKELGGRV